MNERERLALEFVTRVIREIFKQQASDELLREVAANVLKATYVPRPPPHRQI